MRPLTLLVVAVITTAINAATVTFPNPRDGNVNGIGGVLFWPAEMWTASGEPRPLPNADNCEVRMVSYSDFDRELVYPCGKWFVPSPDGRFSFWLEGNGRITPTMNLMWFKRRPFTGHGMATLVPLTPAGKVTIPSSRQIAPNESLRFLSLDSPRRWGSRVFDRRVSAAVPHAALQMPEGHVVAGRFDSKTNDAIALSRPVEVAAGKTTTVWPEAPVESDVFAVLSKPAAMQHDKPSGARPLLDRRAPDVLLDAFDRVIAIWYAVASRHATLSMKSDTMFLAPRQVDLARGKVVTIRSALQPLPNAHVSITVPPAAVIDEPLELEVAGRHVPVKPGTYNLEKLPAEMVKITLHIGAWRRSEVVDLSSGQDANVTFDLKPIAVTGTVFYGDERAAAEIEFLDEGEWRSVKTNERGEYATTFWWPRVHMPRVKIGSLPPYLDAFRDIVEDSVVDFHVPRTDYLVRVRDAETGTAVAGAEVSVGNESADTRSTSQRLVTGGDGVAVLPPLRTGDLTVKVRAEHYETTGPLRVVVDNRHHELDIALKPQRTTNSLSLRLADGAPASGAEVWAFDAAMTPVWRGTAGESGRLDLPQLAPGALLLVRHPGAASTIRPCRPDDAAWTLDPAAEPLTVVSKPAALVALWLDGVKLAGPALAFATWSAPATNNAGVWVGRNLPPKPLSLLILPSSAYGSLAYDTAATRLDYPWPARVDAPLVQ